MSPEERQLLAALFERVRAARDTPRDADAERFIRDAVRAVPEAPYFLAQAVVVQQRALEEAAARLRDAEQRIADLESAADSRPARGGGLFGSAFGGSVFGEPAPAQRSMVPRVPSAPQGGYYGQDPQPGRGWGGRPSGGLFGSILGSAAGVAGGILAADAIGSLFSGRGGLFGGGNPIEETVNNTYIDERTTGDDPGDRGGVDTASAQDDGSGDWGGDLFGGDDGSFDV